MRSLKKSSTRKPERPNEARTFYMPAPDNSPYIGWGTADDFNKPKVEERYLDLPVNLYIRHTRMPDCCGISLLSYFHSLENASPETRKAFLKAALEEVSRTVHTGGVIVTTSVSGQPDCVKTMLEIGFKEVVKCGNPNSGHTVSTFFYTLAEEGAEIDDPDDDYDEDY
jgi:hypothetical protein